MNIMKAFVLYLSIAIIASAFAEDQYDLEQIKTTFAEDIATDIVSFINACVHADYPKIYSFANSKYKEIVPERVFIESIEGWKLTGLDILKVNSSYNMGFYLIVTIDEQRGNHNVHHTDIFIWKFEDKKIKFVNFPFSGSNVLPFVGVPAFYD